MTNAYTDEVLDLVNNDDVVIGQKPRSAVYAEKLTNFRVINAFVVNDRGELWIPRRTANKRIYPLHLDVSVGGHVETGETYEDAFRREAAEELNIDIQHVQYKLLGHLTPSSSGVSAFMQVYEIPQNSDPQYNPRDFVESFWLSPHALLQKIADGDKAKSDLEKLVRAFYLH
jgi:isopentenyl-diphosphate delta-isomerase